MASPAYRLLVGVIYKVKTYVRAARATGEILRKLAG
jgi:hypothetical protein